MTDNSAKLTLEEKVTQRIKSDTLMSLVGDEDAITELVRRAVHEALYQPVRVLKSYGGGWEERDSIAVSAAREVAKEAAQKLRDDLVKQMVESPEVMASIHNALQAILPAVLSDWTSWGLKSAITDEATKMAQHYSNEAINLIRNGPQR